MNSPTLAPHELHRGINLLADQLCRTVDGEFDITAQVDTPDETLQKLVMLVNSVLDAARRGLAELEQREAMLWTVLHSAAEGIITTDGRGIVQTFNRAAVGMFGYEPDEVIGRNVAWLMPEDVRSIHDKHLLGLQLSPADVAIPPREVTGRRKNGAAFPVRLAVSQVETSQGRMFTAICYDLTEDKQRECERTQAQRLESVGQLAAGIAHEINTPTQYVGDNMRFLKEAFAKLDRVVSDAERLLAVVREGGLARGLADEVERHWKEIELDYLRAEVPLATAQSLDGITRVSEIVRAMKEFSHPGSAERTYANLNDAIVTTLTVSRNEWKYVAEVETDLDPSLPQVPSLPGELNQVILNLIVNAAHAIEAALAKGTSQKGTIRITTRADEDWVEIRIADTGCGIPESIRHRVFDPFFTTKGVGKGTGQGLAIARSVIVDKHGGTIGFQSEVGVGTTFIVRLPRREKPLTTEVATP